MPATRRSHKKPRYKQPGEPYDAYVLRVCGEEPNILVPQYLAHSFLYYELDYPILLDATYDALCVALERRWGEITHPHLALVDRGALLSGTGFYLRYPAMVVHAAVRAAETHRPPGPPRPLKFDPGKLLSDYDSEGWCRPPN